MILTVVTIVSFIAGVLVGALIVGSHDRDGKDNIIWKKLDEHEKAIGE